jgi:hypothetical protein
MLPGQELPNDDPANPCFGCGARNPHGLRMRFFDDGEVVRSELLLSDDYCGWPGTVMSNVVVCAMDEVLTWLSWARFGKLATDEAAPHADARGRVRTGVPFVVEGRVVREQGGHKVLEACVVQEGEVRVAMQSSYRAVTAEEAEDLLKRPALPPSLREDAEDILRAAGARRA